MQEESRPAASNVLKKMKGSGTPCALVLTYGNRAYEDAPRGLGDIVAANGFRIKGVATMASQHTYGQIQLGRPNKDDIAELQEFIFSYAGQSGGAGNGCSSGKLSL